MIEALVFDNETNGLLEELTVIHCVHLQRVILHDVDPATGRIKAERKGKPIRANDLDGNITVAEAVKMLAEAPMVIGHNIIAFDIPATAKVFPGFRVKRCLDTLLLSTLTYGDLKDRDFRRRKEDAEFPGKMIGRHSLEAWGYRLKCWKGDYSEMMKKKGLDPWASWNKQMDDYCAQDVVVTVRLLIKLLGEGDMPMEAIELEQAVAPILARQQRYGFLYDREAARRLEHTLMARRAQLEDQLKELVQPWEVIKKRFIAKRNNKKLGRIAGQEVVNKEMRVFNPRSRPHIADRLTALYGWKPMEFTEKGAVKIDEDILSPLKYPIIPVLLEHFIVNKRLGQLSEGKEAWSTAVKADGRVHGSVNQNAAVTGRMTHSKPNMAQVPKVGVPYGKDCRGLFIVPKGKKLVGADASGLELRCLAHFMAKHDDGEYGKVILEGDIHSVNQAAAGLPTRDNAKTFIYAFLYGAGDHKLGTIIGRGKASGGKLRAKFLQGLPALEKLSKGVKKAAKKGWIKGLDGRKLHIRSDHAALNTLLQSAGALVMKKALVILDQTLQELCYIPGVDYEFVGNIHDEWQIECDERIADQVGQEARNAITKAGDAFGFRCRLDGEYKVGNNWAETH